MSEMSKVSSAISSADLWLKEASTKLSGSAIDTNNASAPSFDGILASELGKVFGSAKEVDKAVKSYSQGDDDASIERTVFLMAKAEADLKVAVQVRNKAVSAYQEVMNLQI